MTEHGNIFIKIGRMPFMEGDLLKAEITSCPNKRMKGRELRRLRVAACLSERELGERLGGYKKMIQRWEGRVWFELSPPVMGQLLSILGASSL